MGTPFPIVELMTTLCATTGSKHRKMNEQYGVRIQRARSHGSEPSYA